MGRMVRCAVMVMIVAMIVTVPARPLVDIRGEPGDRMRLASEVIDLVDPLSEEDQDQRDRAEQAPGKTLPAIRL